MFHLQFNDGLGWRSCNKQEGGYVSPHDLVSDARGHRSRWPRDDLRVWSDDPNHDRVIAVWKREEPIDSGKL